MLVYKSSLFSFHDLYSVAVVTHSVNIIIINDINDVNA